MPLGNISVFPTIRHIAGVLQETPIFYVNNETEEIIAQDTWKCSAWTSNFYFPGYDGSALVQVEKENGDVKEMIVTVKKIMDPKEISLHFLLTLNEDFDDDLLQDALDLLHN
jgi:hypothetical protein